MRRQDARDVRERLLTIWSEVLAIPPEQIPPDRNFFTIGGDSILILKVMDRVNSAFFAGSPDDGLPLADFFTFATLQALANRLEHCDGVRREAVGENAPVEPETGLHGGAIAIIGMAARFPGAADVATFWRNLREGVESLRFFSDADLIEGGATPEDLAAADYVRGAGLVDGVQSFDAESFNVTPAEAALMAPEQRLLLECAQDAMDEAAYGVRWRAERVGVFVGCGLSTYLIDNLAASSRELESAAGMRMLLGNSSPATRISYLLNLTGPSITIDTACSSSLVAVHQGCRSILNGECEMALAGGATVRRTAPRGYRAEEGGIFSPDGHCRPFDRQAQGTVSASGAGMVLLKRLDAALADRDSIYAVIRGSAINNDGNAKVGYTAPSVTGQADVIRLACAAAGLAPADLQYIETHGTATALGDMIEIAALDGAWGGGRRASRCALGTLKANVGHLEAAAGVAGLMKVALALKHREIPPAIHFRDPNPQIDFERTPFYLNRELETWRASAARRSAGVSSFGIGGTNVHAVLEEPPARGSTQNHRESQLLVLSAQSPEALRESARRLAERLASTLEPDLADVAFSLQVGRAARPVRGYCVCDNSATAVRLLGAEAGLNERRRAVADSPPMVFMFSGETEQHARMMCGIDRSEPVFREYFDRCARSLRPSIGVDLREILRADDWPDRTLAAPEKHAMLFASEYALASLWRSWGVVPSLVMGHGVGEYVAACFSGVLSLEDGLVLACTRERVADFHARLESVLLKETTIPLVSGLNGSVFGRGTRIPPDYWIERLQTATDIWRAVQNLVHDSEKIFLEIGPGTALSACVRNSSESGRHTVISSCRNGDASESDSAALMHAVGAAWQAGATIHWSDFNSRNAAHRVALPTYPFERRRYWIDRSSSSTSRSAAPALRSRLQSVSEPAASERPATRPADWFYVPVWKQRAASGADGTRPRGCSLLFDDGTPIGETVGQVLRDRSRDVVRVRAGKAFMEDAEGFTLDPAQASDYSKLINVLSNRGRQIDAIVHAWRTGVSAHDGIADENELTRGFYSLLYLCQALEERLHGRPLDLIVLTNEAHVVLGEERGDPHDGMLSVCARVIGREFANLRCHSVDLSLSGSVTARERGTIELAISDALAGSPEAVVAYRGSSCFVPTYEQLDHLQSAGSLVRPGGTYLITGGLGGIGLTLAGWLGRMDAARIVLTSRSEFLPRGEWNDWLEARGDDAVGRRIRKIREIEACGAEVLIMRADVTHADQMRAVVARIMDASGVLHGVIHAAGLAGGGVIALRSRESVQQVIAPKITGTQVLLQAVKDLAPNFFVCCSSIAAILAPPGQFDYCAANAFQDAVAQLYDRRGRTRFISINWDGWSEEGMALGSVTGAARKLDYGMSCEEGCQVFRRILESPRPRWIISMRELRNPDAVSGADRSLSSACAAEAKPPGETRHSSRAPSVAEEEILLEIWRDLLGVPEPRVDDDFFELGGDSLLAIQLGAHVESRFGVSFALRQLLQTPTISGLAQRLRQESAGTHRSRQSNRPQI